MVTTLTGSNTFLIKEELASRMSSYIQEYSEMGMDQFSAEDMTIDGIREAVQSVPFLIAKKLVIVRDISQRKDLHDEFIQLAQNVPDTAEILVVDEKLDKRTALYKVLAGFDLRVMEVASEYDLVQWTLAQAKKLNVSLDTHLARLLVQRTGENQWIIASELQKLADLDEPVTETTLLDMVEEHPRETIFQLLDAVISGNTTSALSLYDKLKRAQLDPHYVLSMLIWQLHLLGYIQTGQGRTLDQIAREAKASPYVMKKLSAAARKIHKQHYLSMVEAVFAVDIQIKSASVDADSVIEQLIVRLATISSQ